MPTSDAWGEVVSRLREEGDPQRSPILVALYRVAEADGPRFLSSFRRQIDQQRMLDLVHDLLSLKLSSILAAESPRAYFRTALVRRAISWTRRGDAPVAEAVDAEPAVGGTEEEERLAGRMDAEVVLGHLSERDKQIVLAVAHGEDRETVAREARTSRANVDQIVSRTHRKLRGGDP